MAKGQFTREEIFEQSVAWSSALREVDAIRQCLDDIDFPQYRQVIFTGCGSSYYLSLAAATLFQGLTGISAKAVPSGELLMNPRAIYDGTDNFLFPISRSGSTTEVVDAVEAFKRNGAGTVLSISIYDDRPLTQLSDICLCIKEGQEQSIAQTRAFSSMYIAATALSMLAGGHSEMFKALQKLPDIGTSLIEKYDEYVKEVGENLGVDRFYFLGSGDRYGLACEANLKMKEMSVTHTEPFYFLEFRHGPISMVNENTVVVGLLSESRRAYEEKVLDDARGLGAEVVSLCEQDADISFASGLPEDARNVLYLPLLQLMAFYRSLKKGLDPDRPKNLEAVVYLA